jgi:hypothetical protein
MHSHVEYGFTGGSIICSGISVKTPGFPLVPHNKFDQVNKASGPLRGRQQIFSEKLFKEYPVFGIVKSGKGCRFGQLIFNSAKIKIHLS